MEIGIIGTSVWQQNMNLLEQLTIDRNERQAILGKLKEQLKIDELIYLATCNRVEFIYATNSRYRGSKLLHRIIDFFLKGKKDVSFFPNDLHVR